MPQCDLVGCSSTDTPRVCTCGHLHHHFCANAACAEYEGEGWDQCPSCYFTKQGKPASAAVFVWRGGEAAAAPALQAAAVVPPHAAAAAPMAAKSKAAAPGKIGSFFAPSAPRAAASPADDDVVILDDGATAARAAGAALAGIAKPPLNAAAEAREEAILATGKREAAKASKLAKPRAVAVNDGGARKRKSVEGEAGAAASPKRRKATRGAASGGSKKQCKVTPETRLRDFVTAAGKTLPQEGFVLNKTNRKFLFCKRCNKAVTTFADRIADHVASDSHNAGGEAAARAGERQALVEDALAAAQRQNMVASGAAEDIGGVPQKVVEYRLETLEAWLKAGCKLSKLQVFRPTMEQHAQMPLTDSSHMRRLVPVLRNIEVAELRLWVATAQSIGLAVDSATREGECFAVTARIVNRKTFVPETRVIALRCYESSFSGTQQAAVINRICFQLGIEPDKILMIARDRAAYGKTCFQALQPFVPNAIDSECFPHTCSHVGEQMNHKSLSTFVQGLSYIWTTSNKGRSKWEDRIGATPPTSSDSRWWSWWECMSYMMQRWGEVEPYLRELEGNNFCAESVTKCFQLLNGYTEHHRGKPDATPPVPPSKTVHRSMRHSIMLELAAVVDWGEQFRKVTALLESDGHVIMDAYDLIQKLEYGIMYPAWPNVEAVSKAYHHSVIPKDAPNLVELLKKGMEKDMAHVLAVVAPAAAYFKSHFGSIEACDSVDGMRGEMSSLIILFKHVRIVDPFKAVALFRSAGEGPAGMALIDNLARVLPILKHDHARIAALKKELPDYLVCVRDAVLDEGMTPEETSNALSAWWAERAARLPAWSSLALDVLVLVPSSCAVERVFSILRDTFGKEQKTTGEDLLETSIFLQYNRRPGSGRP